MFVDSVLDSYSEAKGPPIDFSHVVLDAGGVTSLSLASLFVAIQHLARSQRLILAER